MCNMCVCHIYQIIASSSLSRLGPITISISINFALLTFSTHIHVYMYMLYLYNSGWICYAEKTHGSYILPHISTAKSPQQVMGSLVKSYLAGFLEGSVITKSDRLYHVTVMPCYDKKLEASRQDFYDDVLSTRDVDCVITTGWFFYWLQVICIWVPAPALNCLKWPWILKHSQNPWIVFENWMKALKVWNLAKEPIKRLMEMD